MYPYYTLYVYANVGIDGNIYIIHRTAGLKQYH